MSADQLLWCTARASGLVAWALLSGGVIWGLALSTKVLGPKPRPSWMLDLHRFLGGAAVAFVGIHVGAIVLDRYTSFGVVDVLVPLTSAWNPTAVAWGIVAMYLLLAVEVTSLLRRHLSKRSWHVVHLLSFPLVVVSTVHLLTAGTDVGNPILTAVVLLTAAAIGGLTGYRFLAGRTPPTPTTPRPAPRPAVAGVPGGRPTEAMPPVAATSHPTSWLDGHPAPTRTGPPGVARTWPPPSPSGERPPAPGPARVPESTWHPDASATTQPEDRRLIATPVPTAHR
jgi:DMSO/TMAO reductase YedYZ heme-binding membrane subunit